MDTDSLDMVYSSSHELFSILEPMFRELVQTTEAMDRFSESNLVIRLVFDDLEASILLDGRTGEVFWEERPGRVDLELIMSSALFHDIMMDVASLRTSFMQGTMRSKGNVFRALPLAELITAAQPIYHTLVSSAPAMGQNTA